MIPGETQLNFLLDSLRNSGLQVNSFSDVKSVGGGSINDTYRLASNLGDFFLKINSHSKYPGMFDLESDGLETLRNSGSFRVPEVILVAHQADYSYLLMEYVEEGVKTARFWESFAGELVTLHRNTSQQFGYHKENYIGSLAQSNLWHDNWAEFFIEQRLEPQLRLAGNLINSTDQRAFEKLFHRMEHLVPAEPPSLLHGDLWGGNYLVDKAENPVLIDPAVYYGHREVDLAMMHLFGGFSAELFELYNELFPLENDWRNRIYLHNLYPLLVHVNLFGGSYLDSVRQNLKHYL